jgi:hypothetical protein
VQLQCCTASIERERRLRCFCTAGEDVRGLKRAQQMDHRNDCAARHNTPCMEPSSGVARSEVLYRSVYDTVARCSMHLQRSSLFQAQWAAASGLFCQHCVITLTRAMCVSYITITVSPLWPASCCRIGSCSWSFESGLIMLFSSQDGKISQWLVRQLSYCKCHAMP